MYLPAERAIAELCSRVHSATGGLVAAGEVPCAHELVITGCGAEAGPGNACSVPLDRDGSEAAPMVVEVHQPSMAGRHLDDRHSSIRIVFAPAHSYSSSPLAFGDDKSMFSQLPKPKLKYGIIINEGGCLLKKKPEVPGKGKNVIVEESDILKIGVNKNPKVDFNASPSSMILISNKDILDPDHNQVEATGSLQNAETVKGSNPFFHINNNKFNALIDIVEEGEIVQENMVEGEDCVEHAVVEIHINCQIWSLIWRTKIYCGRLSEGEALLYLCPLRYSAFSKSEKNEKYTAIARRVTKHLALRHVELVKVRRKQKELGSLYASRGSKRSWVLCLLQEEVKGVGSLPHLVWWKGGGKRSLHVLGSSSRATLDPQFMVADDQTAYQRYKTTNIAVSRSYVLKKKVEITKEDLGIFLNLRTQGIRAHTLTSSTNYDWTVVNQISFEKIFQGDPVLCRHLVTCENTKGSLPTLGKCEQQEGSLPTHGEFEQREDDQISYLFVRAMERTETEPENFSKDWSSRRNHFSSQDEFLTIKISSRRSPVRPGRWEPTMAVSGNILQFLKPTFDITVRTGRNISSRDEPISSRTKLVRTDEQMVRTGQFFT
ncbi:hypothetical protein MA16_Dca016617 [Dendrobium catenatum]|uniref:Uncharacterized protein n=1 Tax=Dendrobium catenatum TaxID=906689 RepID=A0A2I0WB39_9ASPA|nr:hypothetical protein MA16_Dca016617 [Dendrobium catenatum]